MKARINENGEITRYVKMPKYWANYAGNFDKQPDDIHKKFGFYDVVFPDFDPQTQLRGEIYFDEESEVFTYPVSDRDLNLEDLKTQKREEVQSVVEEISAIVSTVKNLYDPWRDSPENIPVEFKALVEQRGAWLSRANAEIEALATVGDAASYLVRGPEVEAYIEAIRGFLNTDDMNQNDSQPTF